jgi:hypothetical protein
MAAPLKENTTLKLSDLIENALEDLEQETVAVENNGLTPPYKKRKTDEDYLMLPGEMPKSCYPKADFQWCKKTATLCREAKCWLCKVIKDQKEKDKKIPKRDGTKIMDNWIKTQMQSDKWKDLGPEERLLMMFEMLTKNDQEMNTEKNFVSWFGAVRCTRAEVTEMVEKGMMGKNLGNCWGFMKILDEDMTGKNTSMAFLCTKDRGNASYSHFLRIFINKAVKDKKMGSYEAWAILSLGAAKMGNVLEAIMGEYTIWQ